MDRNNKTLHKKIRPVKSIIATRSSKNMIGAAGEYFVCAELCRRNILALITPKNNPLFDIVATDPKEIRTITIQVKTMGIENKQGWKLSMDLTKNKGNPELYVVLVNMKGDESNDYYIYLHDDLCNRINQLYKKYISTKKRDGEPRKDLSFRWFDLREFNANDLSRLNNWKLLGF
jgi:hypothetical protein